MTAGQINSTSADLARHFVQGTESSLPLGEALLAAADGTTDRGLAKALRALAERIQTGEPLPQVLAHNSQLPPHLSGLLRASLATGEPATAIADWLTAREQAGAHWRNVMQSLAYPLVTLFGSYCLFLFMAFQVVPGFRQLIDEMNIKVPETIRTTYALAEQGAPLSLMMLGGTAVVLLLVRLIGGRRGWSHLMAAVPLFGPLWHWSGSCEFYRALAIFLDRQIALPEALQLTGTGISDAALAQHCGELAKRVEKGTALSAAMQAAPELPASTFPLVRSGERSGTLPTACRTVAEMLEGRLQAQSALLLQLAPTVIFLLTAGMYAALMALCFLPMRDYIDMLTSWGPPPPGNTPLDYLTGFLEDAGTISWTILLIPGVTMLIALQIFYRKRVLSSNLARLSLATAAWLLIVVALIGGVIGALSWMSLLFLPMLLLAMFMLIDRFRRGEHQALLHSLAYAAERGVPLPETAQAYAEENVGDTGARAQHLAEQIAAGATLSAATRGARLRLSTPQRLAVNLSDVLVARGLTLRTQLSWGHDSDAALRVIVNRLLYFCGMLLVLFVITVHAMLRVVPVFRRMFDEFGFRLPVPTQQLFGVADWLENGGLFLVLPLLLLAIIGCLIGVLYYTGWYDFPFLIGTQASRRYAHVADVNRVMDLFLGVRYVFWRYDASLVLRSLSLLLSQRVPMPQALTLLANVYPRASVRRRLTHAATDVERGGDWLTALRQQWLLGSAEVAVLQSAARAGNLPWALEEMGDALLRRLTYRLMLLHQTLYPILLLIFGVVVAFVSISLMLPLIALIQGLA